MATNQTVECPECAADIPADELEFTPGKNQFQPGQLLIEYSGTCPDCNRTSEGASHISIQLG